MIKEIVVITQYTGNDYCDEIIRGIKEFYADKPVRVSILEVRTPDTDESDYEYQYFSAISLANAKSVDAVILIAGTFCSVMSPEKISKLMRPYFHCPVVSVSIDIPFDQSYYTKVDSVSGIHDLINHMVHVHGRKNFGMITSGLTSSKEGEERFQAFKDALKANNLELSEDNIINSNFQQSGAIANLSKKYKKHSDIKFDALFCANDLSAIGAVHFLQENNFKIPEDICIAGYDDCFQAANLVVPLTTINQQLDKQGYEAARVAYDLANGKEVEHEIFVPVKPVYRESCGCCSEDSKKIDYSMIGNVRTETKSLINLVRHNVKYFSLLDKIQSSKTLTELYHLLDRVIREIDISAFAICLYKEPVFCDDSAKFDLPQEAEMTMLLDKTNDISISNKNLVFNPHENIIPKDQLQTEGVSYIYLPIFFGEKQYGYLLYSPGNEIPSFYSVYMKILSNTIARAYDYTVSLESRLKLERENETLQKNNSELNMASKTDEMTKVYNRRGFLFLGQQTINLALQIESGGVVLFGDMDGLKKINDTYGHDAGDEAIKAEAKILQSVFRSSDIVGRLGGDEFAIVASGMKTSALSRIRNEIDAQCLAWQKANNSPYKLSISLGAVEFNKDEFILQDLLSAADEAQYIEKKLHHEADKNK